MVMEEIIEKLKQNKEESRDINEIIDPKLDLLRKERQKQLNREEKIALTEEIREDRRQQLGKGLFGIKENANKKVNLSNNFKERALPLLKQKSLLVKKNNLLKQKGLLRDNNKKVLGTNHNILKSAKQKNKVNILKNRSKFL